MKDNNLYKLNKSIYIDEDNCLISEHWIDCHNKNIDTLYAKKGQVFKKIDVTKENFDELCEEYFIDDGCIAIYVSISTGKDIYIYDKNCDWFDKLEVKNEK